MDRVRDRRAPYVWFAWTAAYVVVAAVMLRFAWIGYVLNDDLAYIGAARGWLADGAFQPADHWEVRHTLVLPLALSIKLFGLQEWAIVGVSAAYWLATVSLLLIWLKRRVPAVSLPPLLLLLVTTPLFLWLPAFLNVDVVEVFWCLLSAVLFIEAAQGGRVHIGCLIASGVAAGLAFTSRETAVGLLVGYGLLFLAGRHVPRKYYFVMAAGFAGVIAAEMLYYTWLNGNPFHRYSVLFLKHDVPDFSPNWITVKYIEPIAALFFNNDFGLFYFIAVASTVWLLRRPKSEHSAYAPLVLLGFLALAHFLTMAYGLGLRALPRYFSFFTLVAAVFASIGLTALYARHRVWALGVWGAFLAVSLFMIDMTDRQPVFANRAYSDYARAHPGQAVFSDPGVCWLGVQVLFLETNGADERSEIDCRTPKANAVLLYSPEHIAELPDRPGRAGAGDYEAIRQVATLIEEAKPNGTYFSRLWAAVGLEAFMPLPERAKGAQKPVEFLRVEQLPPAVTSEE